MTRNAQRQAITQRIVTTGGDGCTMMGVPGTPEHGVAPSCVVSADAHRTFAFTARPRTSPVFHFLAECHLPSPINIARYSMLTLFSGSSECFVKGEKP